MDFEYVTLEDWHKTCKRRHKRIQADAYSYISYTERQMYSPDVLWITGGYTDIQGVNWHVGYVDLEAYRCVGVYRHLGVYWHMGV